MCTLTGRRGLSSWGSLPKKLEVQRTGSILAKVEIMKIRLLSVLVGFAISVALPIFAQQKDTLDLQTAQQRDLIGVADNMPEINSKLPH
jgi:hypothetical protein